MFRKIRKSKNELNAKKCKELLKICKRGVLSLNGDDGYPYGIPINYYYDEENNSIFFHGAKSAVGHKKDALKRSDKVSFTIIGPEEIRKEAWAPFVCSVIVFGNCKIIEDREIALDKIKKFALKYYPNMELVEEEINKSFDAVDMFCIKVEHMSGKEVQER